MEKMHIKTGDTVIVLSGDSRFTKDSKGERTRTIGEVIATSPEEGKVIVKGVNVVSKHTKARKQGETGGIVKTEGAVYASKVQLICPHSGCEKHNKATRVRLEKVKTENGKTKTIRRCYKCGKEI